MSSKEDFRDSEEYQNRLEKKKALEELGITIYPHNFSPTDDSESLKQVAQKAQVGHSEEAELGKTPYVAVAGRLMLFRPMGKNAFAQIQDRSGRVQIMFNRDHTHIHGVSENALKLIEKRFDLGDIIGIEGHLFYTNKGELTVYAKAACLK